VLLALLALLTQILVLPLALHALLVIIPQEGTPNVLPAPLVPTHLLKAQQLLLHAQLLSTNLNLVLQPVWFAIVEMHLFTAQQPVPLL
jgi:hypothetical protein